MQNKVQIKATITGRVQGVFYRASTKKTADSLGIKGYVKNLANGAVEAVFEGDRPMLTKMMDWCRKGPSAAKVDHVLAKEIETVSDYETFEILY